MGKSVVSSLLALTLLGRAEAAGEDNRVIVTPSADARGGEIDRALKGLGRKDAELGNGKQIWTLTAEDGTSQATIDSLRRRKLVQGVDTLGWDVRRPFDTLGDLDLTPDQEAQITAFRALPTSASVRLFRLPSPELAAEVLRYGLVGDAEKNALLLTLEEGASARFKKRDVRSEGPELVSWTGLATEGRGNATLVVTPRGITGTVLKENQVYSIRPLGSGLHAIIKLDTRQYPADEPPSWRPESEEAHDAPPPPVSECTDKERRIDVVVAYTSRAASEAGDIDGLVKLVERETNDSFLTSNVQGSVRIVKVLPVAYSDSKRVDTDLAALRSPGHPSLGVVRQEIHDLGADVGILLTGASDYCGVAAGILAKDRDDSLAVVAQNCAGGYYSFAHELGHLLGARHDPCSDSSNSPFPFGHGYLLPGNTGRTIMSYGACCGDCTRLPLWANASRKQGNLAMGSADCCNDHLALNLSIPRVAAFGCPGSH